MTLFIANATRQRYMPCYRLPETSGVHYFEIDSGKQIAVGQDWSPVQVDAIVAQLERFGAKRVEDISKRVEGFNGLMYSLSKPVDETKYHYGNEVVNSDADHRAQVEMSRAALAADAGTRDPRTRKRRARKTKLQVVQESRPGHDSEAILDIEVTPEGTDKPIE